MVAIQAQARMVASHVLQHPQPEGHEGHAEIVGVAQQ